MDEKPGKKTDKPGSGPGGSKPNPDKKDKLGAGEVLRGGKELDQPGRRGGPGPEGAENTKGKPKLKPQEPSTLEQLDEDIREFLGADPFEDSFRPARRRPNDEGPDILGQGLRPPAEEEVIVPGDPSNLGARAGRRRKVLEVEQSPVLRRGLLGV